MNQWCAPDSDGYGRGKRGKETTVIAPLTPQ